MQRRGIAEVAVPSEEGQAVGGIAGDRLAAREKRRPLGERRIEPVPCEDGALVAGVPRLHLVLRQFAPRAQRPFGERGQGEPPATLRVIAKAQHRDLDGGVLRHAEQQIAVNPVMIVGERGAPGGMANLIGPARSDRGRRRTPEISGVGLLEIQDITGGIPDGVIVPRGQAEEVRILRPGAAGAPLGYDESPVRICNDVHPRRRRDVRLVARP